MLETCQVRSPLPLPAITHVDGSARPQTVDPRTAVRFAALLEAFRARTGVALLVNTSLNVRGEPIVCSPVDALTDLVVADLDALVLEDLVVTRDAVPPAARSLLLRRSQLYGARNEARARQTLYSFF
jgi:carbamoyltransferase